MARLSHPRRQTLAVVLPLLFAGALPGAVQFTAIVENVPAPTAFVDPPDKLEHRFVARQNGRILVWEGPGTAALATPLLDLSSTAPLAQRKVAAGGERGLLAMTVHPNYAANGYAYLYYTSTDWDGAGGIELGDVVIERYTRSAGDPNQLDFSTAQLVLVVPHSSATNHNGGDLKFGPDGFLYVAIGDGGGGCDSVAHSGQDVTQLLGKMLRIDVDGDAFPADPRRKYRIPASNPLVGQLGRDEIWALGLRNPFRFSFDRFYGNAYIGDVGQKDWEEVNDLVPGTVTAGNPVNFGWPCREGTSSGTCDPPPQGCTATFTDPVLQQPNDNQLGDWGAIIGGFVYRGNEVPEIRGLYLYGDATNGEVWRADPGAAWDDSLEEANLFPYGFAEDGLRELYVLSNAGDAVLCVHDGGGCPWALDESRVFADGFESGDTAAW